MRCLIGLIALFLIVGTAGTASGSSGDLRFQDEESKIKLDSHSVSWQLAISHSGPKAITFNIEIDLIDKDGFVIETLTEFCRKSDPWSCLWFKGLSGFNSDVKKIKTVVIKTKSMSESFCDGFGVEEGESSKRKSYDPLKEEAEFKLWYYLAKEQLVDRVKREF